MLYLLKISWAVEGTGCEQKNYETESRVQQQRCVLGSDVMWWPGRGMSELDLKGEE